MLRAAVLVGAANKVLVVLLYWGLAQRIRLRPDRHRDCRCVETIGIATGIDRAKFVGTLVNSGQP